MLDQNKTYELLKSLGWDEEKIKAFMPKLNTQEGIDLLAKILAGNNLGRTSEEKVLKHGDDEIPFQKTETDADIGADGEIQEKKKETHYATSGDLVNPPTFIDKHKHVLTKENSYDCYVCLLKCCPLCAVMSRDRFGFITIARHRECILCEHCNKPSNSLEDFSDMHFVSDDLGNIVKAYHKTCRLSHRIMKFLFLEGKPKGNSNKSFKQKYLKKVAIKKQ